MKSNLVYFGHEKIIYNLNSYQMLEKLFNNKFIILIPSRFEKGSFSSENIISSPISWEPRDEKLFWNYLLWANFFTKKNTTLNMFLRVNFLGTSKIYNTKSLLIALKNVFRMLTSINWPILRKIYRWNSSEILRSLRTHKIIKSNCVSFFLEVIRLNQIKKVFIISTFNDPSIFDLVEACDSLDIPVIVLPESWDNISTSISIPHKLTGLYVWSDQQYKEVAQYYPELLQKTHIIGSYRITRAINYRKPELNNSLSKKSFKILYLEGYYLEDITNVMNKLLVVLEQIKQISLFDIEIIYRSYPLKKQTDPYFVRNDLSKLKLPNNISIKRSSETNLWEDVENVDLIISESTTAGLEAAFQLKPILFIYSKKSKKFVDTKRSYKFSYASDLKKYFKLIDIDSITSQNILSTEINNLIFNSEINDTKNNDRLVTLDYFGKPFDFNFWKELCE